jgi:hypothetical protein
VANHLPVGTRVACCVLRVACCVLRVGFCLGRPIERLTISSDETEAGVGGFAVEIAVCVTISWLHGRADVHVRCALTPHYLRTGLRVGLSLRHLCPTPTPLPSSPPPRGTDLQLSPTPGGWVAPADDDCASTSAAGALPGAAPALALVPADGEVGWDLTHSLDGRAGEGAGAGPDQDQGLPAGSSPSTPPVLRRARQCALWLTLSAATDDPACGDDPGPGLNFSPYISETAGAAGHAVAARALKAGGGWRVCDRPLLAFSQTTASPAGATRDRGGALRAQSFFPAPPRPLVVSAAADPLDDGPRRPGEAAQRQSERPRAEAPNARSSPAQSGVGAGRADYSRLWVLEDTRGERRVFFW